MYDFNQYICAPGKGFPFWGGFFLEPLSQIYRWTYSKSIFTIQGVLKNGKYHEMGLKLRYMTSINIVALPKSFPLWGGAFMEPFVPNI